MSIIMYVLASISVAAWLVSFVNGIRALSHRAEGVTIATLMFYGYKNFDPNSFTREGRRYWKYNVIGAVVFFVCVVTMAVLGHQLAVPEAP